MENLRALVFGQELTSYQRALAQKEFKDMEERFKDRIIELAQGFIDWRDSLHSETRGGRLMFDVPKHYKWLNESELLNYYICNREK